VAALLALAPTLLFLLAISALISAAETAMTAASRGRMHQLERDGDHAARRVNLLLTDRERMIGAILLSYNVINIFASSLTTSVLTSMFPQGSVMGPLIATVIMSVLVVVFAEILPKTLAIAHPDNVARVLSIPTYWTVRLFGPIANGIPPALDYLETVVPETGWLVDGVFSIADLSVPSFFANARMAKYEVDAQRWPKLAAYLTRAWEHPAWGKRLAAEAAMG